MKVQIKYTNLNTFPTYGTNEDKIEFVNKNNQYYIDIAVLEVNESLDENTLETVYKLTQNGYDEQYPVWTDFAEQYECNTVMFSHARSASVGDVFVMEGVSYIVSNAGFIEVK